MTTAHPVVSEEMRAKASSEEHSGHLMFSESPTTASNTDLGLSSSTTTTIVFSSQPAPCSGTPISSSCTKNFCFTEASDVPLNMDCNSNAIITPSPPLAFTTTKRATSQFSVTRPLSLSTNPLGRLAINENPPKSGISLSVFTPTPNKNKGSLEVVLHRKNRAQSTAYIKSDRKNKSLLLQGTAGNSHVVDEKHQLLHIRGPGVGIHPQERDNLSLVINLRKSSEKAAGLTTNNSIIMQDKLSLDNIVAIVTRMFPEKASKVIDCYTKLNKAPNDSGILLENGTLNKRLFNAYYKLSLNNNTNNLVVPNKVTTLNAYVSFMEAHLSQS